MNVTSSGAQPTLAQARQLLTIYTYVLDEGPLGDWPGLFTETCLYRITTRQNEERNMPLSIMLWAGESGGKLVAPPTAVNADCDHVCLRSILAEQADGMRL